MLLPKKNVVKLFSSLEEVDGKLEKWFMIYVVRDRDGNESYSEESKTVRFLYGTFVGRLFVKVTL